MLTIGSLFSGIGGLEKGLESSGLGRVIWQVEQDQFCRTILAKHWPDADRSVCDVRLATAAVLSRVDILCGGFPCFAAGTLIETSTGLVKIENIRKGDMVLTHEKRFRPVVAAMTRAGAPLVEVCAYGAAPVTTTAEHPFYTRRRVRRWDNSARKYAREWTAPEWTEAKDLTRDHFLAQPTTPQSDAACDASTALWYIVGRWLGDGWVVDRPRKSKVPQGKRGSRVTSRSHRVVICCAHKEAGELSGKIASADIHATAVRERTATKFHIESKSLFAFLKPFGRGAAGKRLPGNVFGLPVEAQQAIWDGWLDSDGHRYDDGSTTATTVSRELAYGMAKLGRVATGRPVRVYLASVPATTVIEGRTVNQRPQYQVRTAAKSPEAFFDHGFAWVPTRSVRHLPTVGDVFNIEVADDNSYVADSFVVHNCQDVSAAGAGAGLSGARSGLWYEYHRAVLDLRPRAVVVENVASGASRWLVPVRRMLETSGYRTRAVAVAAADVGAPHRRSRIFVLGLADAMRSRPQGADERQSKLSDAPGCREALADADRLRAAQSQGRIDELGRWSLDCGQALAHFDRLDIRIESGRGERQDGTGSALSGDTQPVAESNMGRVSHGLPAGLDLPTRWPAGQGAYQHDWEPPRTIPKGSDPHRRARLKALGNAVVPACGYVAGRALIEWMTEVQS